MSKIGARVMREQRAESRAARRLLRDLLEGRFDDEAAVETMPPVVADVAPIARDELREIERWALLVALLCAGFVAVGAFDGC
jgi:hypothetical protein